MPDTLKTAITLPGELETLATADSSPMHIIGHATITIQLKNLQVTHHFIIVESLMTDVILGIDFQREYRISYDWVEDKDVTSDTKEIFSVTRKTWSQELIGHP